jgi:hypothetical protein
VAILASATIAGRLATTDSGHQEVRVAGFRIGSGTVPTSHRGEAVEVGPVSLVLCGDRFANVARLVAGAFASNLGLGFEQVDDLQLAVELVLRSLPARDARSTLELATGPGELTAAVGTFSPDWVGRRLGEPVDRDGLDLRSCLERLVDRIEVVGSPSSWLVLAKAVPESAE